MLTSFIVDLKLREDGQIKICEFGRTGDSGFEGYRELTGRDMIDFFVMKLMKKEFDIPIWCERNGEYFSSFSDSKKNPRDDFDPKNLKSYSGIFYPNTVGDSQRRIQIQYPHMMIVDAHGGLMINYKDKAINAIVLENTLGAAAPAQGVFLKQYTPDLANQIRQQLGEHEGYVIKPTANAKGTGVIIVSNEDLEKILHQLFGKEADKKALDDERIVHWDNDKRPVFVVQSRERSKPVMKDGKAYDGTMRVAMTAWTENDEVKLHIHDAYWKLPPKAIGELGQNAISYSSPKSTSSYVDTSIHQFGNSALVSDADKALVFRQLQDVIPGAVAQMLKVDFEPLMRKFILSDDPLHIALGTMMATNFELFNQLEPNPEGSPPFRYIDFPDDIAHKILDTVKQATEGAVSRYLHALNLFRSGVRVYHPPYQVAEKILDQLPFLPSTILEKADGEELER